MAKVNIGWLVGLLLTLGGGASAQTYRVVYQGVDADSNTLKKAGVQNTFISKTDAEGYLLNLPAVLQARGYVTASVDTARFDSATATAVIYLGEQYQWSRLSTAVADKPLLEAIRFPLGPQMVAFADVALWQQRIITYLEENGRPFGRTYLDSIRVDGKAVSARLKIDRGPAYFIDSLQVFGDAKVANLLLQNYLDLPNGSAYNKLKLQAISKKIAELTYVEEEKPADVAMLASGAVVNLYLKQKRNSQVNALLGFLPNSGTDGNRKLLLTVDANILLKNALGNGETIGLVWQQLQKSSPRLNFLYEQPYLFRSQFSGTFSLDIYKRDSIFLNINMNLGLNYRLGANQLGGLFFQRRQTIVSGVNAATVIATKQLPQEADVSSSNLGLLYDYNSTNYRQNPRKGNVLFVSAAAGTKRVKKSNLVLELKDPVNPAYNFDALYDTVKLKTYQVRLSLAAAHYIPLGRQSTVKLGANAGLYNSQSYYRNELFQIGGSRLLRGFDEESQFVAQYAVGTLEYRYLIGRNANFFVFTDGGWGQYPLQAVKTLTYISTGTGLSFETKAGVLNLTYAVGSRSDASFNLRQSKIHIGFVSYF